MRPERDDTEIGHFIQADTVVPGEANPIAYNRFAYIRYNPLKYSDPTGHGWFDEIISQFITGAVIEVVKNGTSFIP